MISTLNRPVFQIVFSFTLFIASLETLVAVDVRSRIRVSNSLFPGLNSNSKYCRTRNVKVACDRPYLLSRIRATVILLLCITEFEKFEFVETQEHSEKNLTYLIYERTWHERTNFSKRHNVSPTELH